jgi:hypothetical protein
MTAGRVAARTLVFILAAALWSAAAAASPDLKVEGAEARLGAGGGFWPGAWATLRLEASGPGEYRLALRAQEGTLRGGLSAVTAVLNAPDRPGVREASLELPLVSRRPVYLTLQGPRGRAEVRLDPFPGTPAVAVSRRLGAVGSWRGESVIEFGAADLDPDPALWLAGPTLVVQDGAVAPDATRVLAWLAGGGRVVPPAAGIAGLERVPRGAVGLGWLERDGGDARPAERTPPDLAAVMAAAAPRVAPPARRNALIGLWAAAGFLVCLGVYSARREEVLPTRWAALVAVLFGLAGAWALQPVRLSVEAARTVRIGALGWGVESTVATRLALTPLEADLPAGARLVTHIARRYEEGRVVVAQPAWQRVTYWTRPRAAAVPVVLEGERLSYGGERPLSWLYVVGAGPQEPVAPGRSQTLRRTLSTEAPADARDLIEALPQGAAVARDADGALIVALPAGAR